MGRKTLYAYPLDETIKLVISAHDKERVSRHCQKLGLSISQYIRQVLTSEGVL